jgi:hypothetical protein
MKHFIIILTILLSTGFTTADRQENADQSFKIEISYIGLPHPVTTKYSIDNNKLTVYQTHYDSQKDSFVDFNKTSFKKFDKTKLVSFLNRTDWKSIPEKLVTPTIDGYHYTVNIVMDKTSYSFDIDNTYHPTFDSLFTICTKLIPTKKGQKTYYLPYSDWRK